MACLVPAAKQLESGSQNLVLTIPREVFTVAKAMEIDPMLAMLPAEVGARVCVCACARVCLRACVCEWVCCLPSLVLLLRIVALRCFSIASCPPSASAVDVTTSTAQL